MYSKQQYLYNETFNTALVHQILEEELKVFTNYEKTLKDKNSLLSIHLQDIIGTIQLKMALAKAIICKNTETIQEEGYSVSIPEEEGDCETVATGMVVEGS